MTAKLPKDLGKLTDEQLADLFAAFDEDKLTAKRAQVEIENEIALRRATANLSPTQRIALGRHLASSGETTSEKA